MPVAVVVLAVVAAAPVLVLAVELLEEVVAAVVELLPGLSVVEAAFSAFAI